MSIHRALVCAWLSRSWYGTARIGAGGYHDLLPPRRITAMPHRVQQRRVTDNYSDSCAHPAPGRLALSGTEGTL